MAVEINVVERVVVESTTPTILEVTESAIEVLEQTTTVSGSDETTIEIIDAATQVVTSDAPITVLEIGTQGPQGIPGVPEDEMTFAKRVDFVGTTLIYRGEAAVGSAESSSVWRIRRITFTGAEEDVTEEWASGNATFDKIWDDRLSLSYS